MSSSRASAVLGLAALLALGGCDSGTFAVVNLSGSAPGATRIDLELRLGGRTAYRTLAEPAGPISLPTDASFRILEGTGDLAVLAVARGVDGAALTRGEGHGLIVEGQTTVIAIVLGGATVDMAMPDVAAPDASTADLATEDLAVDDQAVADLSVVDATEDGTVEVRPDLRKVDMVTIDLLPGPDLFSPDLAPPPPWQADFVPSTFDISGDGAAVLVGTVTGAEVEIRAQCLGPDGVSTGPSRTVGTIAGTLKLGGGPIVARVATGRQSLVAWHATSAGTVTYESWIAFLDDKCGIVGAPIKLGTSANTRMPEIAASDLGQFAVAYEDVGAGAYVLEIRNPDGTIAASSAFGMGVCKSNSGTASTFALALGMNRTTGAVVLVCEAGTSPLSLSRLWRRYDAKGQPLDASWTNLAVTGSSSYPGLLAEMTRAGHFAIFGRTSSYVWSGVFFDGATLTRAARSFTGGYLTGDRILLTPTGQYVLYYSYSSTQTSFVRTIFEVTGVLAGTSAPATAPSAKDALRLDAKGYLYRLPFKKEAISISPTF